MNFIDLVNHMADNNNDNLKKLSSKFRTIKLDEARKLLNEGTRVFASLNGKMKLINDHFQLDEMVNQEAKLVVESIKLKESDDVNTYLDTLQKRLSQLDGELQSQFDNDMDRVFENAPDSMDEVNDGVLFQFGIASTETDEIDETYNQCRALIDELSLIAGGLKVSVVKESAGNMVNIKGVIKGGKNESVQIDEANKHDRDYIAHCKFGKKYKDCTQDEKLSVERTEDNPKDFPLDESVKIDEGEESIDSVSKKIDVLLKRKELWNKDKGPWDSEDDHELLNLQRKYRKMSESVKIEETGEMSASDIMPGGEDYEWAMALKAESKKLGELLGGYSTMDARAFDKYQGPYITLSTNKYGTLTIWDGFGSGEDWIFVEPMDIKGDVNLVASAIMGDKKALAKAKKLAATLESVKIDEKKLQEKDMIYASKLVDMLVRQGKPDLVINDILKGTLSQSEIANAIASSRKHFKVKDEYRGSAASQQPEYKGEDDFVDEEGETHTSERKISIKEGQSGIYVNGNRIEIPDEVASQVSQLFMDEITGKIDVVARDTQVAALLQPYKDEVNRAADIAKGNFNDNPADEDEMDIEDFGDDYEDIDQDDEGPWPNAASDNEVEDIEDDVKESLECPHCQSKKGTDEDGTCQHCGKSKKKKKKVKESAGDEMFNVATKAGLDGDKAALFVKFMSARFPKVGANDPYATEWAERIANGSAWTAADIATKQALTQAGFIREGMETDTVLDEEQVDKIGDMMSRLDSNRQVKEANNLVHFNLSRKPANWENEVRDVEWNPVFDKLPIFTADQVYGELGNGGTPFEIFAYEGEGTLPQEFLLDMGPKGMFVVDTQGYDYARYVGRVNHVPHKDEFRSEIEKAATPTQDSFPDVADEVDESLYESMKRVKLTESKKDDELTSNKKKLASILRKIHKATDDSDIDQALDLLMKHYVTKDANVEAVKLIQGEAERKRSRLAKGDKEESATETETEEMIDDEITDEERESPKNPESIEEKDNEDPDGDVDNPGNDGDGVDPDLDPEPELGNGGEPIPNPNPEPDDMPMDIPVQDDKGEPAATVGEPNGVQEVEKKILVGSRVKVNGKDAIVAEIKDGVYKLLDVETRQMMYNDAKDTQTFDRNEIEEVIQESKLDEASRYDAALKQLAIGLADDIGSYMHEPGDEISNSGEIEQVISDYAESWIPELVSMVSQILKRKGFKITESKVNEYSKTLAVGEVATIPTGNAQLVYGIKGEVGETFTVDRDGTMVPRGEYEVVKIGKDSRSMVGKTFSSIAVKKIAESKVKEGVEDGGDPNDPFATPEGEQGPEYPEVDRINQYIISKLSAGNPDFNKDDFGWDWDANEDELVVNVGGNVIARIQRDDLQADGILDDVIKAGETNFEDDNLPPEGDITGPDSTGVGMPESKVNEMGLGDDLIASATAAIKTVRGVSLKSNNDIVADNERFAVLWGSMKDRVSILWYTHVEDVRKLMSKYRPKIENALKNEGFQFQGESKYSSIGLLAKYAKREYKRDINKLVGSVAKLLSTQSPAITQAEALLLADELKKKYSGASESIAESLLKKYGLNEGTWSLPQDAKSAKKLMDVIKGLEAGTVKDAKDAIYHLFGDDDLFDALDKTNSGPGAALIIRKKLKKMLNHYGMRPTDFRSKFDQDALDILMEGSKHISLSSVLEMHKGKK